MLMRDVSGDYQKLTPLSMEKEGCMYPPGLLVGMKMVKISVIARSMDHNRFG